MKHFVNSLLFFAVFFGSFFHFILSNQSQDVVQATTSTSPSPSTTTIYLKSAHVGSTNSDFEEGDCSNVQGSTDYAWHYVIPGNDSTFVSLSVVYQNDGLITDFISHPTGMHAYQFTTGIDTIVSASAEITGTATEFNLSHVCVPNVTPTPTPTDTPDTTPTPTPTESPDTTPSPSPTDNPETSPTPSPSESPEESPTPTPESSPETSPNPSPSSNDDHSDDNNDSSSSSNDQGNGVGGGQVLGATTDVAYADTGIFEDVIFNAIGMVGSLTAVTGSYLKRRK